MNDQPQTDRLPNCIEAGFRARRMEMESRLPWEQDPDEWIAAELKRIALERGISLREASEEARETLRRMFSSGVARAVKTKKPINVFAADKRFGLDGVPAGYVREGDRYVYRAQLNPNAAPLLTPKSGAAPSRSR